jgi:hypothetical protein
MPGFPVIKKVKKGELKSGKEFLASQGITDKDLMLGGAVGNGLIGGGGAVKKAIKVGAKAIKMIRKKLKEKKK